MSMEEGAVEGQLPRGREKAREAGLPGLKCSEEHTAKVDLRIA
jgi:hypothetical protein